ncbi:ATP synthase F0 subunit B [Lactiplantibacillus plantarum]|uniref:F0F1 ATP synthase subunit B n=1 Tax=Lactiplantibacillus plantarum TaxID=1590 RepID=UPI000D30B52C|nr:F0F1 ATP synthase subunit B [Lactiplantibacillus plantarum]MBO2713251.1 F0F1 ATP synthase subunit B [Lactiplantibacillus plantarum]PTM29158.1 ATP synthase F0 subunit B [Lactiplantibacillus plantarum]RHF56823.1 ATP synthase F0 subunit B [Lactiplantibacillus plantarum]
MFTHLVIGASGLYLGDMLFIAISFLILMALIAKFAWNPVLKMMSDRAKKIASDIDEAQKSRHEASALADQRRDALAHSRSEASDIVADAKKSGEKQRSSIVADAQNEATQYKQNARKDIEQERQDALKNVQSDVADISVAIATKIIKKQLDPEGQQALINSYIEGLGKHES